MHDKRYSIFISSTFEDLKAERQAVQDVVISAGDFLVQMESFPAADEDQFDFIKALIDKCDYYVLIVAGRYGTPSEDGMSYTEKEYRYAVSKGIPVLVMLHGDQGSIPARQSEDTAEGKKRLKAFIAEVETNRLRKTWTTPDALKLAVREALEHAKATRPAVGWVRGDAIASIEALEELNEVRKQNERFREEIGNLEIEIPLIQLPEIKSVLDVEFLPNQPRRVSSARGSSGTIRTTWLAMFPIIHGNLKWGTDQYSGEYWINEDDSLIAVGSALIQEVSDDDTTGFFKVSKGTLQKLVGYYVEAGLMRPEGAESPFTEIAQKIARRHRLAEEMEPHFLLRRGSTAIIGQPLQASDDDEIPF
jgi:hypothetical protein